MDHAESGQVHTKYSYGLRHYIQQIDHGVIFGCAESCGFMRSVPGDVQHSLCSAGSEREVGLGVPGAEAGFGVGDGDHQDVH